MFVKKKAPLIKGEMFPKETRGIWGDCGASQTQTAPLASSGRRGGACVGAISEKRKAVLYCEVTPKFNEMLCFLSRIGIRAADGRNPVTI